MKLIVPFSMVVVFNSMMLAAQNADQHQSQATIQRGSGNCPVSLHAEHSVGGDLLNVSNSGREGVGQRLYLTVTNSKESQISRATVTVLGSTLKGRVEQSLSNHDESSDAAETMDVTFSAGSGNAVSAYLWVPGLTAVQAIDLKSLTYADGSSWKPAAGETCHFIPDALMLIASH